ncbi:MAG: hypothetical protein WBP46_15590 [Thiolinea sp.]
MKKSYALVAVLLVSSVVMSGCASSRSSSMGTTASSINANRGASSSVMSAAQARQYAMQQEIESREIAMAHKRKDLDNRDLDDTLNSVDRTAGTVAKVGSTLKYLEALGF